MDQMHANTKVLEQARYLMWRGDPQRRITFVRKWGEEESWVVNDLLQVRFVLRTIFKETPYKLEMHPDLFKKMLQSAEIELLVKLNNAEEWEMTPENVCNLIGCVTGINYIVLNEEVERDKLYVLDIDDKLIALVKN